MQEKSSSLYLFGDLLALARQSWVRQMAEHLEQRGFDDYRRSDAVVMRLLRWGPVGVGALGQRLGVTRQAARKLTTALERRGYAQTRPDARDARRLNVELTAAGREYADAIVQAVETLNRELAVRIEDDQLHAADAVLRAAMDPSARQRADALVRRPGRDG